MIGIKSLIALNGEDPPAKNSMTLKLVREFE